MKNFFDLRDRIVEEHSRQRKDAALFFLVFSLTQSVRIFVCVSIIAILCALFADWSVIRYAGLAAVASLALGPVLAYLKIWAA